MMYQPIGVAVDATNMQSYTFGSFDHCGTDINTYMVLVKMDTFDYTLKNSWGTSWGERGYIRLTRGSGANICGICMAAIYPTA